MSPSRRRRVAVAAAFVLVAAAGAVALAQRHAVAPIPAAGRGVSVVDDTGVRVAIPAPALRIVSLAPNVTELLFAAGAGAQVVGVMSDSDYPPAARSLPVVGRAEALELERIAELAPDLIVAWPWVAPAQVEWLRARGVPIFIADPQTPGAIADDLEKLGRLAGTAEVAAPAADALRARLRSLAEVRAGHPPLRVFYEISDRPLYTIGGRHLITRALELCGATNVFAGEALPAPQVDVEAVLAARPDAIVAGARPALGPAWLAQWRRFPDLPAVRDARLFTVDADLLHRSGPRFVDGVAALCEAIDLARDPQRAAQVR